MTQEAIVVTLLLATIACASDLLSRKIPNYLTYSGLLMAIVLSAAGFGASPSSLMIGFCMGLLPPLGLFLLGCLGGGDVKLLAALGALLGFPLIVDLLLWASAHGAGLAVLWILFSGKQRHFGGELKAFAIDVIYGVTAPTLPSTGQTMPFALPILLAVFTVLFIV